MDPENAAIAAEQNAENKRVAAKAARERRKRNPDREVKVDDRLRRRVKAASVTWGHCLTIWRFDHVSEHVSLWPERTHVRAGDEIATVIAYWADRMDRRFVEFVLFADGTELLRGGVDRGRSKTRPREYVRGERIEAPTGEGALVPFVAKVAALAAEGPDGIEPPRLVLYPAETRGEILDMRATIATEGRPCGTYGDTAIASARRVGVQVQKVTADDAWAIGVLDGDRVGVFVGTDGLPWRATFGRVGE